MKIKIKTQKLSILLFQCAYIANVVFGSDPELFVYSKIVMLLFWGSVILYIARELHFQVEIGTCFLLPVIFTFFCAASCFWAVNKDYAFSKMTTQWQLLLLFVFAYILLRQTKDIEPYFQAVYISGFALLALTIYRYGLSGFIGQMMSGIRMGAKIGNQNDFGMSFSMALIIAFYYYLRGKRKIHFVSIAIFLVFALSSGSKKALLMCMAGVIGMSVFYYGFRKIWKTILAAIAVVVIGYYLMQLPLFAVINERITSYFSGELNVSDLNRMRFIEEGSRLIKERPFFGWGLANFSYVSGIGTYSHNNFIEVWVSTGMFGFLTYYSVFAVSAYAVLRRFLHRKEISMIVMLIVILINIVFGYGMVQYETKDTWLLFAMMMAIVDERRIDEGEHS